MSRLLVRTDYAGSPWIAPGKVYEAELMKEGRFTGMYRIASELDGSPVYFGLKSSCHINRQDWEIVDSTKS